MSVHCCLVVICWERADLLALVGDVYCIFVTFPCGIQDLSFSIQGQVWYLCRFLIFAIFVTFNDNWPFDPSPGGRAKKCAVARPIHVSNSYTKFDWILSNGLGDSDAGNHNIPQHIFKKRGKKHGDN